MSGPKETIDQLLGFMGAQVAAAIRTDAVVRNAAQRLMESMEYIDEDAKRQAQEEFAQAVKAHFEGIVAEVAKTLD